LPALIVVLVFIVVSLLHGRFVLARLHRRLLLHGYLTPDSWRAPDLMLVLVFIVVSLAR
jgi:hypothetical protein